MHDSDWQYFSRFSLDPDIDYGRKDLSGFDFSPCVSCDENSGLFDDENLDSEDLIFEDDFLFDDSDVNDA